MCNIDLPVTQRESTPVARKRHDCCECRRPIIKGQQYHVFSGIWDKPLRFKTCQRCQRVRNALASDDPFGCVPPFGHLREWLRERNRGCRPLARLHA